MEEHGSGMERGRRSMEESMEEMGMEHGGEHGGCVEDVWSHGGVMEKVCMEESWRRCAQSHGGVMDGVRSGHGRQ